MRMLNMVPLLLLLLLPGVAWSQFGQVGSFGFGNPEPDRTPGKISFDKYKELSGTDLLEFVCTERNHSIASGCLAKLFRDRRMRGQVNFCLKEVAKRKKSRFNTAAWYAALLSKARTSEIVKGLKEDDERGMDKAGLSMLSLWAQFMYSQYEGKEFVPEDMVEVPAKHFSSTRPEVSAAAITAAAYGRVGGLWPKIEEEAPEGIWGIEGAKCLYRALITKDLDMDHVARAFTAPEGIAMSEMGLDIAGPHPVLPDKAAACRAIGIANLAEGQKALAAGMRDQDIRTQLEAAKALRLLAADGRISGDEVVLPFAGVLKTCAWPVLIEATAALAEHPDKRVIPLLMQRLQSENGRMRQHLLVALGSIAGELHGKTAEEWITWYRSSFKAFEVDKNRSDSWRSRHTPAAIEVEPLTTFYGHKITSSRFALVLDTSETMEGGKIYELRQEAFEAMRNLKKGARFAMIGFDDDLDCVGKYNLTGDNKAGAFHAMALERGPLVRRNADALAHAVSYPEVDTVYFVTGGAPMGSRFTYWPDTKDMLALTDRYRPVDVHVISYDLIPALIRDVDTFARTYRGTHKQAQAKPPGTDPKFVKETDSHIPEPDEVIE